MHFRCHFSRRCCCCRLCFFVFIHSLLRRVATHVAKFDATIKWNHFHEITHRVCRRQFFWRVHAIRVFIVFVVVVVVVAIFLYFSVDFLRRRLRFLPIEFVFDFIRNGKRRGKHKRLTVSRHYSTIIGCCCWFFFVFFFFFLFFFLFFFVLLLFSAVHRHFLRHRHHRLFPLRQLCRASNSPRLRRFWNRFDHILQLFKVSSLYHPIRLV